MGRVVTVSGGKGGVGKTFVAANLAKMLSKLYRKSVLLVDIDVSNPCVYTLVNLKVERREPIKIFKPELLKDKCVLCSECVRYCPTHSLLLIPKKELIFIEVLCEGCATCLYVCPFEAIAEGEKIVGWVNATHERDLMRVVYGELVPGSRQEGEVMERTLEFSKQYWDSYNYIIIDTPPGTGRGIMYALQEAEVILSVTEPTKLGLHDLKKLHRLVKRIGKREIVILNKYGIPYGNYEEVENFIKSEELKSYRIPYDNVVLKSYFDGKSVLEYGMELKVVNELRGIVEEVLLRKN